MTNPGLPSENEIFCRSRLLLGNDAMKSLAEMKVIVFGVGGVGSWCAESLVRTGVRHLTIVDCDNVAASNINRQLMANVYTVGQPKVTAFRQHLLEINPNVDILARNEVFTSETANRFDLDSYDYIIDAIDSLSDKILLIDLACRSKAKLFSSMGAALKLDPTKIKVAEFRKVVGCPLARALRQRFKKRGTWPSRKFMCVFSDELLANKGDNCLENEDLSRPETSEPRPSKKACINGSLMHITAIFGLTLAGLVISDSCRNVPL